MGMQKGIGFVMILTGCLGLGFWYSSQFNKQIETLREFCRILELFTGQIRFGRCTLQEGIFQLIERVEEPYREIFIGIYEEACRNQGESFGSICKRYLETGLQKIPCLNQDREIFIECFTTEGFEEDTMQLRLIEQAKEELEERRKEAVREKESKCRLALSLGAMSGLLIVLLFL